MKSCTDSCTQIEAT